MRFWVNLDDFPHISHQRKESMKTTNVGTLDNVEVVSVLVPVMSLLLRAVMLFIHTKRHRTLLRM